MKIKSIECVYKTDSILGESPLWSPQEKVLYWVDISKKMVHRFDPLTKENTTKELPQTVTSVLLRQKGGLVLTLSKEIVAFEFDASKSRVLLKIDDHPDNRINDAKCDRKGRIWAGTMNSKDSAKPTGTLFCIDKDLKAQCMGSEFACSNGIGWSPDNATMYFTETFKYAIHAYDFEFSTGNISNERVFASIQEVSKGSFDGLTVDAEGYVWSAIAGGGKIIRYHPSGKIDQIIEVPIPRPTSCVFGGENLDVLYVTSAREILSESELEVYPLSGSLFALKTDVKGIPESYFKG